jgi:uncharacterized protein
MAYALVTGASKGIGKSIALELAARGHDLLLVARDESALVALCNEVRQRFPIKAEYLAVDLSSINAANEVFDWVKSGNRQVDVLVNNAGYGLSGNFTQYNADDYANMIQLNILTLVKMCRMFVDYRVASSQGYIMNIASTAAYQAVPGLSLYAATKVFVLNFSRALDHELRSKGIIVTAVSPGATDTGFAARAQLGEKGLKMAEKVNMTPDAVAKIAVKAMFAGKREVVTGLMNKIGAGIVRFLPKSLVENMAGKIYQ